MKHLFLKGTILTVSGMLLLGGCSAAHREDAMQETGAVSQEASEEESMGADSFGQGIAGQEPSERPAPDTDTKKTADGSVPTIRFTQERKEWYTEDGKVLLYTAETSRGRVLNEGFDALQASLDGQWKGLGDDDQEAECVKEYHDTITEEEAQHFVSWGSDGRVEICRIDARVVSLREHFSGFFGGAHGTYGTIGRTYDVESGAELQLEDILSDPKGFYDKAFPYIIAQLAEHYEKSIYPDYAEIVRTGTFGETPASWYLDNTGIVIDYQLYQIAPYAGGMQTVTLPYDEFAAYIKEDYLMRRDSFVASVEVNQAVSGLPAGTGEVMLTAEYLEGNSGMEVTVVSGDVRETVGIVGYVFDAYVFRRADGRSFLIFYCEDISEDTSKVHAAYVYEVTGGNVRACDRLEGASWSGACLGMDRIGISMYADVGTYQDETVYRLTDDGKLIPEKVIK
ncbi:MAG: RsiV family protein [Lachnospiraceae bacterium]|nr:RsiV family protein [Lachnospiraceae bacterium]